MEEKETVLPFIVITGGVVSGDGTGGGVGTGVGIFGGVDEPPPPQAVRKNKQERAVRLNTFICFPNNY